MTTKDILREQRGRGIKEKVSQKEVGSSQSFQILRRSDFHFHVSRVTSYFPCFDFSKYSCCANPRGALSNNRIQHAAVKFLFDTAALLPKQKTLLLEIKSSISGIRSNQLLMKRQQLHLQHLKTEKPSQQEDSKSSNQLILTLLWLEKELRSKTMHLLRLFTTNQG